MKSSHRWQIVTVVALGLFMAILDNTIVSVTLPQMQKAFHTDFETITWVATAYFLAQAAVIPIVGYLSDRIGSKLVFISSLIIFTLGSALCALAPTKEALIAFRIFQGIGGGALLPVAFAIIYRIFPPNERGAVTAVIGVPILMAPAFGPTIGGFLGTNFDWNAIFTINLPIGVIALILAFIVLPGRLSEQGDVEVSAEMTAKKRFDIFGLLLAMAGFTALVYGISEAGSKGWQDHTVLAYIIAGLVILVAFTVVELRVSDPVMDLRLFKNYTFSIANLLMGVIVAVLFGSLFLLPLFFENVQGYSSLTAGETLITQGLATGLGIALSGALYNRIGPRIIGVIGLIFLVAGTFGLTRLNVDTSAQSLQVWLIMRGFGLGFVNTPIQTLALSVVSNKAMAKASSLVSVLRQVAGALGVAALTTYVTQRSTDHAQDIGNAIKAGLQTHQFSGVASTCVQAGGPTLNQLAVRTCVVQHATTMGMTDTFMLITICCAVSIVLALILGRDPAIEAYKRAKARGEDVELAPTPVLSE